MKIGAEKRETEHQAKRGEEVIYAIQEILLKETKTSIRRLSRQAELSAGAQHKLLRKDLHVYNPFKNSD